MMTALVLALAVAAQAPEPELPAPAPHRVHVDGPAVYWVWGVKLPNGHVRPVEYSAPAAPARPSFETNGVVAEKLADDGRMIRASDPATMIQAQQVIEQSRRKPPEPPSKPCLPDLPELARDAASAWLWSEMVKYYIPAFLLTLLALVSFGLALRLRRPS